MRRSCHREYFFEKISLFFWSYYYMICVNWSSITNLSGQNQVRVLKNKNKSGFKVHISKTWQISVDIYEIDPIKFYVHAYLFKCFEVLMLRCDRDSPWHRVDGTGRWWGRAGRRGWGSCSVAGGAGWPALSPAPPNPCPGVIKKKLSSSTS